LDLETSIPIKSAYRFGIKASLRLGKAKMLLSIVGALLAKLTRFQPIKLLPFDVGDTDYFGLLAL
jgi:hypothetical protein